MVDKRTLRIIWISGNVFLYLLMLVGTTAFVHLNFNGIIEIGMGTYWFTLLFGLLFVSIFGTVRIIGWIKEGKL